MWMYIGTAFVGFISLICHYLITHPQVVLGRLPVLIQVPEAEVVTPRIKRVKYHYNGQLYWIYFPVDEASRPRDASMYLFGAQTILMDQEPSVPLTITREHLDPEESIWLISEDESTLLV